MNNRYFGASSAFVLILFCFTFLGVLTPSVGFGEPIPAPGGVATFKLNSEEYNVYKDSVEVPNMPPIRSQDGMSAGACTHFSQVAYLQQALCQKRGWDCKKLKPEQTISEAGAMIEEVDRNGDGVMDEKLGYEGDDIEAARFAGKPIITNKCAPLDVVLNDVKNPDESAALHDALMRRLEETRKKVLYELDVKRCEECGRSVANAAIAKEEKSGALKFPKNRTAEEKIEIFVNDLETDLVGDLIVPERCRKEDLMPAPFKSIKADFVKNAVMTLDQEMEVLKDHLKNRKAPSEASIAVIARCPEEVIKESKTENCKYGLHTLLVSGYRKACNKAGKCIHEIKLHNSWGQGWQDQANGGWVDAKNFVANSTGFNKYDIEFYE